nr:uncharacterized protein LOC129388135 isoform X1 [Dermacentor andersoni]
MRRRGIAHRFRSGLTTITVSLVPANECSIRLNNPQAAQEALHATSSATPLYRNITDIRLSDTPGGRGARSACPRICHRLEGHFRVGLASKSRALEATNPEVDGPSFGDGAAALAADARARPHGTAATTLVVVWAGAGVCCDAAPLRAAPAYPEVREYAACPPSQLGQWGVPLQLLDSCSCSPHFAQPQDKKLRETRLAKIATGRQPSATTRVCSKHRREEEFCYSAGPAMFAADGSEWVPNKSTRICSNHFVNGENTQSKDILTSPHFFRTLTKCAKLTRII